MAVVALVVGAARRAGCRGRRRRARRGRRSRRRSPVSACWRASRPRGLLVGLLGRAVRRDRRAGRALRRARDLGARPRRVGRRLPERRVRRGRRGRDRGDGRAGRPPPAAAAARARASLVWGAALRAARRLADDARRAPAARRRRRGAVAARRRRADDPAANRADRRALARLRRARRALDGRPRDRLAARRPRSSRSPARAGRSSGSARCCRWRCCSRRAAAPRSTAERRCRWSRSRSCARCRSSRRSARPSSKALAHGLEARRVPAGTAVVREGEPGDRFYVVADGELDVDARRAAAAAAAPRRRLRRDRAAAGRAAHGDRHGPHRRRLYALEQGALPGQRRRPPAGGERGRPRSSTSAALAAGDNRPVIDPLERWRRYGEKPDYAGLLTYGGAPYTQDPAELAGFDVAIVGAPTDDLVSDRPGARFGPRAIRAACCPPGPHLESKVDAFEELRIVDFGDAAVLPADAAALARRDRGARRPGARRRRCCRSCSAATTRSPSRTSAPSRRATGPVGLVHFDTHTDTGREVFGVELSHGTPMFRLVEAGTRRPAPLRADRPARLLAGRARVRVAGRARDHELLHARRARARDRGRRRADGRARRRRARST